LYSLNYYILKSSDYVGGFAAASSFLFTKSFRVLLTPLTYIHVGKKETEPKRLFAIADRDVGT